MRYQITVYHNGLHPPAPYQDGQPLLAAMNLCRDLPAAPGPQMLADWAYELLRTDLGQLHALRHTRRGGELEFLAACVYRLLGLRPPRVGDVFEVANTARRWWLAREMFSWKTVRPPFDTSGQPVSADTSHAHQRTGGARR